MCVWVQVNMWSRPGSHLGNDVEVTDGLDDPGAADARADIWGQVGALHSWASNMRLYINRS